MKKAKKIVKDFILDMRHKRFRKLPVAQNDITILSNCCIGGCMYNDMGMRFLSPTINLFFGHHGFIDLVSHLEDYKTADLIDTGKYDIGENGIHGPICHLVKNGLPVVEIHFLHYPSFEYAKKKWVERYERINKDKIFLVIEAKEAHEHGIIDEYVQLPFPKIIFTDLASDEKRSIKHMSIYDKKGTGRSVTEFTDIWGHRGYDEYDFVNDIFNRDYSLD